MMESLASGAAELGIRLNSNQLRQFESYFRLLGDWNRRVNLTTITGYEDVQTRHFLDSLTVVLALKSSDLSNPINVIDVGTGAGLPGLPLKIAFPEIKLTLLEATAKKIKFLESLIAELELQEVNIISGRAEVVAHQPQCREKFDVVLARAVAALPALVEMTLPLCALGGCFVAQKKGDVAIEVERAQNAIGVMGGKLREIKPVALKALDDGRCLVIIDKISPTPPRYPRRPGMPEKRPL